MKNLNVANEPHLTTILIKFSKIIAKLCMIIQGKKSI